MEGSSDFKLDLASERGPGQKEEIRKWKGPVTSGLTWHQIEDPARNRKIRSGGGQWFEVQLWF